MKIGDLIRYKFSYDHTVLGVVMKITPPNPIRWGSNPNSPKCVLELLEGDGTTSIWDVWSDDDLEVISEAR